MDGLFKRNICDTNLKAVWLFRGRVANNLLVPTAARIKMISGKYFSTTKGAMASINYLPLNVMNHPTDGSTQTA